MENSFYYFFSATPQVLAGILALFAVFVIFKVQSLTRELLALATYLHNTIENKFDKDDNSDQKRKKVDLAWAIKRNIETENIVQLHEAINNYNNEIHTDNKIYKIRKERFDTVYAKKQNLINDTIKASKITGFTIISCLGILPFGKIIICHTIIICTIFLVVLVYVGIIFNRLLTILKKSFE
jgi:hypothetical protein